MLPSTSSRERDPFSGRGTGQVDFQHTSLKRTRSRKKRRIQEMEERQRIRGDSHWSKVLQVNPEDASWFENRRNSRMCRSFHFGQRSSFRAGRERGAVARPNAGGTTTPPKPIPSQLNLNKTEPAASSTGVRNSAVNTTATTTATAVATIPATSRSAEPGLLATIFSKIRQWLQSRRRYEVSPGAENSKRGGKGKDGTGLLGAVGGRGEGGGTTGNGARRESNKDDYLIISKASNHHPELKRSEAAYPHPDFHLQMTVSQSSSAISSLSKTLKGGHDLGASASPVLRAYKSKNSPASLAQKRGKATPQVDINIELVDTSSSTPVELKSNFKANPLKLVTSDTPPPNKTAMMTPATRMLSRSQQLRQSRNKYMKLLQKTGQLSPGRSPLTGTISAPAKHGLSEKGSPKIKRRQIKTWPLPCRKLMRPDDDDPCTGDSEMELPFIQEMLHERGGFRSKSSLKDFSINFEDLALGEVSKTGRRCKLYKLITSEFIYIRSIKVFRLFFFSGRWHGDVVVHVFRELRQKDKDAFWANLGKLCRIRHENIILFMAACTSQPNLAVVTCNPQGKSLYEHIHIQRDKMTMHTKIGVLRQIAQGMGYLHAKGIVLRKLNTKNVFLGHKVKVSAMDYGFPDAAKDRSDYGSIPRGHLTYIAPEILCTIRVIPPRLVPFCSFSPESDVYAFGTIMFEVLSGQYPFHGMSPERVIWQVCANQRHTLFTFKCSVAVKTLIEDCWAHEPLYRPEFRELCKDLQRHSPLHKKHSSSEPRLNKCLDLLNS